MPTAFVLINAEIGAEDEVLRSVNKIVGVDEAYTVYGVYDIITKIKAESMDEIKEIVTWRMRSLNKVRFTLTLLATEPRTERSGAKQ